MTQSTRERAARNMASMYYHCSVPEFVEKDVDKNWPLFLPYVYAVLEEIPTVGDAALGDRLRGLSHYKDDQRAALRDMIDAIKCGEG